MDNWFTKSLSTYERIETSKNTAPIGYSVQQVRTEPVVPQQRVPSSKLENSGSVLGAMSNPKMALIALGLLGLGYLVTKGKK